MKQMLKDAIFAVSMFGPMTVGMALTYMVFGFIAWDSNPANWSWEFRLVATIFAISFGFALSIRVSFRRRNV